MRVLVQNIFIRFFSRGLQLAVVDQTNIFLKATRMMEGKRTAKNPKICTTTEGKHK